VSTRLGAREYRKEDRLQYYRCLDCLEVFTAYQQYHAYQHIPDGDYGRRRLLTDLVCACGGSIQWLGRVAQDNRKLEQEVERSVCDARCTRAHGPTCFCHCYCENHGSELTVFVTVDAGGIPRPEFSQSTAEGVIARGKNYTALRDAVAALLRKNKSFKVHSSKDWQEYQKTINLLVYKRRMDRLQELHVRLSVDHEAFLLPNRLEVENAHTGKETRAQDISALVKLPWRTAADKVRERLQERPVKAASEFSRLLLEAENPSVSSMTAEANTEERLKALEKMLNSWLSAVG
jgi:hypothetical protein